MKKIILTLILLGISSISMAGGIRVPVYHSEPMYDYRTTTVQIPNNCQSTDRNSLGMDTLLGVVTGVAIGNQFRKNKDIARPLLGLGGGYVANQMRDGHGCGNSYTTHTERVITGYKNYYKINGVEHYVVKPYPIKFVHSHQY